MIEYKQNQRIAFDIEGELRGTGCVVGKAKIAVPVLGALWIIEPDASVASAVYPYSHLAVYGCNLALVE